MSIIRFSLLGVFLLVGCEKQQTPADGSFASGKPLPGGVNESDVDEVRAADYSLLFIGNSHTAMHNLPKLVCDMIRSRIPGKKVYSHYMGVGFLDQVAKDPRFEKEIKSRPWKFVVLQAQRISMSGKFEYSRQEGIDFARLSKERGADVLFFSEWGLKGVEGDGVRQQRIYQEMADAAGVRVAPISRAWDIALAERPNMPLHLGDGNHQSELGAFLTACVLFGDITKESPTPLFAFPDPQVNEDDRRFLADVAARTIEEAMMRK